jgi:hypothetical protein
MLRFQEILTMSSLTVLVQRKRHSNATIRSLLPGLSAGLFFTGRDAGVDAVPGSAWERYIAESAGIKIAFDVLTPTNKDIYVDRSYFGYEGMLNIF